MVNVGVIGLGMMGRVHIEAYQKRSDVRLAAVADRNAARLEGENATDSNISGESASIDLSTAKKYAEGLDLISDPDIDMIDICVPTPLHMQYAKASLAAGRHVLLEKPVTRTSEEALELLQCAEQASGFIMPALCMRFWPGWAWLKQSIDEAAFGRVRSASFRRLSPHPGGAFYSDSNLSGGAILDLHIHDSDFIAHCFGLPNSVRSIGHSQVTDGIDYVSTQYLYEDGPSVTAEGGWCFAQGRPFTMQYVVNFEQATADFDLAREQPLMLTGPDGKHAPVQLEDETGYDHEIGYFIDCLKSQRSPERVTLRDGYDSLRLVEAEVDSIASGRERPISRD